MEIKFRKATASEQNEVFEMYRAAVCNMQKNGIDQWDEQYPAMEDIATDIKNGELIVGIYEEKVAVCYCHNRGVEPEYDEVKWEYPNSRWCAMHRLCVNPLFQRQGLAKKALTNLISESRKQGYESIRIDTFEKNYIAYPMYLKLGFKAVGEAQWRKGRFIVMEKLL